jgi:ribonuclease R
LRAALLKGAAGQLKTATENLPQIAEHTSRRERVAMEAERDIVELRKIQYMQRHLGEEFDGYISGVTAFGFFVELDELFVEGLVHITSLDDDLYTYLENKHSLVGRSSHRIFRIGDAIKVKVAAVLPETRRIEFVLVAQTATAKDHPGEFAFAPEEYPRIPLKGKRPNGTGFKPSTGGSEEAGRGGGKGSGKGAGKGKQRGDDTGRKKNGKGKRR